MEEEEIAVKRRQKAKDRRKRTKKNEYGIDCEKLPNEIKYVYFRFRFQSNKPLMEKRRRARINECLTELKSLVLQAMKKDVSF